MKQLTGDWLARWPGNAGLGVDCLILALVLPQALGQPRNTSDTLIAMITVLLTLCYCTVDLCSGIGPVHDGSAPPRSRAITGAEARPASILGGRAYQIKIVVLLSIIVIVVVLPTMVAIGARRDSVPYSDIGDSALQVEEDATFLRQGIDYYARTFFDTPLAHWWPAGPPNAALYHADEEPVEVVLDAAFLTPVKAILGFFDVRLVYMAAFLVMIGLALRLARGPTTRLALLAGLGLNPLFVPAFINGQDDILVLAEVLAVIACMRRGWTRATLLLLGLACATKYTAVLFVPFVLIWLAGLHREHLGSGSTTTTHTSGRAVRGWALWTVQAIGWIAVPVIVLIGPFLVWNAHAYVDSTIGFIAGTVAHSFPMRGPQGYGFATFVLQGGMVHSAEDYFPFGLFQLAAGLPVLWVLLRRQWRHNTPERAVAGYATLYLVVSYFARFFHSTHLAYGIALFVLAYFLARGEPETAKGSSRGHAQVWMPRTGRLAPGSGASEHSAESLAGAGGTHIRLDFLVVVLLAPQLLAQPTGRSEQLTASSVLLLIVAYAVLAALDRVPEQDERLSSSSSLEKSGSAATSDAGRIQGEKGPASGSLRGVRQTRASRWQTVLLLVLIGLLVVWPSVYGTLQRHQSQPFDYITDNALQTEAAAQFLMAGTNFYATTFVNTPMARWYSDPALDQALYHADELPLNALLLVPISIVAHVTPGWFDERFLLVPVFAVLMWLVWQLGGRPGERRARLAAVVFGPFFVPDVIYGDTDVFLVAAVVAFIFSVSVRRFRLAAMILGMALALKQPAVFLVPLFVAYLWGIASSCTSVRERVGYVWRQSWWMALFPVLTIGPFLIWNASAFWDGTVGFVAGTVPHSYPIRGIGAYGFSAVVILGKLVSSAESYFPFSIIQCVVVVPLLVILCRAIARRPGVPLIVSSYLIVMGFGYFFSRFLQESGVGYILLIMALSCLPAVEWAFRDVWAGGLDDGGVQGAAQITSTVSR